MQDDEQEIVYQIDKNDVLILFNDQWDHFIDENSSSAYHSDRINNSPIWDFIHDAETRHIHETLLKRVRTNNTILNLSFRCDSPSLRRFMAMIIAPVTDDTVEYRCRILKTEKRAPVPIDITSVKNEETFLRMCSWCKKIDVGSNAWKEIEDAVQHLGLFHKSSIPPISHTMCDACMKGLED